jgi:hypothetical protein
VHRRVDRVWQLERLEHLERIGRVDGQRRHAIHVEVVVAQEVLDPLAVDLQRVGGVVGEPFVAQQFVELGEQRRDLAGPRRWRRELRRIEIEEEADDHRLVRFHLRQSAERVLGELAGGHESAATRSRQARSHRGPASHTRRRRPAASLSRNLGAGIPKGQALAPRAIRSGDGSPAGASAGSPGHSPRHRRSA